jgi:DNA polymerase-3 subunit epsilon
MIIEDISNSPIEEADYCVVDVETTGLSPRSNGVIEIGLVKVSKLKIVDTYSSFINPGKEIPYFITQLTGITNEDVYDAPFFEDIADEITDFIGNDILTAHNLSFDSSFLKKEFIYCGKEPLDNLGLCTLKLSRRMYPMLKSKSLSVVCKHLGLKNSGVHRALGDSEVTAKLLIKLIKEVKDFNIRYVNELINYQSAPKGYKQEINYKKKLGEDISVMPDAPGIYYFLNAKNEIIYIGKARSLKNRVKSYFLQTAPRKAKKIIKQSSHLKIELTNTELTALLMEAELIKIVSPRHNVMLREYGNKYFLRISTAHTFPAVEICNHFDFDGNDYFGLFISRKKAVAVQEMILKTFLIRECGDSEFGKGKICFLAEIERCTAPCVNKNKSIYFDELEKVYEFLYGKNQFAINRLLNKMKEYSNKEKFEKASEVKQIIDMILSQTHKTSLLAEPVNSAKVLFEVSETFAKDYVLMIAGKIFIKKYAIDDKDYFEEALDDYFSGTINLDILPNEEDLEKMKITLNWLIKNRNKVRTFYLKDYTSKDKLYINLSSFNTQNSPPEASTFDIKNFIAVKENV